MRAVLLLAALLATAPAMAGARQDGTVLLSTNAAARADQERNLYAAAVVSGDTVYLSGVVAGLAPGEKDMVAAYDRVFRHIGRILGRAGASWDDVVEATSYHTDVKAQIEPLTEIKRRYLAGPPPAWTAIQVAGLLPEGGLTEIKVVAKLSRTTPAGR